MTRVLSPFQQVGGDCKEIMASSSDPVEDARILYIRQMRNAMDFSNEDMENSERSSQPQEHRTNAIPLQQNPLNNDDDNELQMLRLKNLTKNGIINRLRQVNSAGENERKQLKEEVQSLQTENVVSKCIMAGQIKQLELKLEQERLERKRLEKEFADFKKQSSSSSLSFSQPVNGRKLYKRQYQSDPTGGQQPLERGDSKRSKKSESSAAGSFVSHSSGPIWMEDAEVAATRMSPKTGRSQSLDESVLVGALDTASSASSMLDGSSSSAMPVSDEGSFVPIDAAAPENFDSWSDSLMNSAGVSGSGGRRGYGSDPTGGTGQRPNQKKGRSSRSSFNGELLDSNTTLASMGIFQPGVPISESDQLEIDLLQCVDANDGLPQLDTYSVDALTPVLQRGASDQSADGKRVHKKRMPFGETNAKENAQAAPGLFRATSTDSSVADGGESGGKRSTRAKTPVDYFPKDEPGFSNRAAGVKSAKRSGAGVPHHAPKSLADHCDNVVHSADQKQQLASLTDIIHKFTGNVSIATIVERGVPQAIVHIMNTVLNNNLLVHKAMVVLNNVIARATPAQFHEMMRMDFVGRLVELVSSKSDGIQEQAIWILDNIALDCGKYREQTIESGALTAILEALKAKSTLPCKAVTLIAAKALRTLTTGDRFQYPKHVHEIKALVCALGDLLHCTYKDVDIATHSCAALANLTEEEDKRLITAVFSQLRIPQRLLDLLASSTTSPDTVFFAVAAMGHLASGSVEQTETLLSMGLLRCMRPLLSHQKDTIVVTACRCISNVCMGSSSTIEKVFGADLFSALVALMKHSHIEDARYYSAYAVMYATHGADPQQTQRIVDLGALPLICALLNSAQQKKDTVLEAMNSLDMVLHKFEERHKMEHVVKLMESAGGWRAIAALRSSPDSDVSSLALSINLDKLRASFDVHSSASATTAAVPAVRRTFSLKA